MDQMLGLPRGGQGTIGNGEPFLGTQKSEQGVGVPVAQLDPSGRIPRHSRMPHQSQGPGSASALTSDRDHTCIATPSWPLQGTMLDRYASHFRRTQLIGKESNRRGAPWNSMQGQETEIHHGAKQSEGNKQVGSARKVHPNPPG